MNLTKKSVKILKSLQLKNGGILATPQNKAYPYVYSRDAVIMTKALNRARLTKRSEKFYYFMRDKAKVENYKEVFHRYTPQGLPSVTRKNQHDNTALVIHGIYDTFLHNKNKEFLIDMWPMIKVCVAKLLSLIHKNGLIKTETSIHENDVLENGFELWANCAAARALQDASHIAQKLSCSNETKEWKKASEALKKNINTKLFDKKTKLFTKNPRRPKIVDLSQLSPFYFELTDNKEVLKKTLAHLEKNLWESDIGGFRRFKRFEIVKDWHWYTGGSGTWLVLTLWGAQFYKKAGNKKGYKNCIDFVNKVAKRTGGLLPEHIATKKEYDLWKDNETEFNNRIISEMKSLEKLHEKTKKRYDEDIVYWATPLGWSHAEYILLMKK